MRVLFLVTRFPAPPWRGDQVRAYHHLRLLARRHEVTCAALVLRPPPPAARAEIEAMGARVEVVRLGLRGAGVSLARALVGDRRPFQVLLYARRGARARVARLAAGVDVVHAQLVRTLPYLPAHRPPAVVIDLIDALSENLARRARCERAPLGWLIAREAARLRRCEEGLVRSGAPCLVVSESERAALGAGASVRVVPNGVDSAAFAYSENGRPPARLVFTGNLGYFPNVDAASWLAHDILPRVREAVPEAELRLVGARPARAVRTLAAVPGVSLAATVPLMAPELAAATVAVVPLRAGSGLQNKVLEAMAVGTPVVATPRAVAGLAVRPGEHVMLGEDAGALAAAAVALLRDPARALAMARAARELVERCYRWEDSAAGVEAAWRAAPGPVHGRLVSCLAGTASTGSAPLGTARPRLERPPPSGMSRSVYRRDGGWRLRWAILVAGDLLATSLAYLLAFLLRVAVPLPLTQGYLPPLRFAEVHHHWIEMLAGQAAVLYFLGLYEAHALSRPRDHVGALIAAAGLQSLLLIAVYFFRQDLMFPRSIFVVFAALNATLLVGWRIGSQPVMGSYPRRRVLVVGNNAAAAEVIDTLRIQHWLGMDIVGAVAGDGASATALRDVPVLGTRDQLPALCGAHDVDEVIIASDPVWQDDLLDALSRSEGMRARICVVPSAYEILIGRTEHLRLHDIPLIEVIRDPLAGGASAAKRAFDLCLAAVLLVLALPVMLLVALAVRVTSRGPVLFRQERAGKDRRPFTMVKFRTMHLHAEEETGPVLASENDPRATWVGRYLRGSRLDELPQLWNVLRGDMSFVGPRPERPEFITRFERDIQGYAERFKVRPGLSGYAQVNGEYHTSAATKLKYDLAYIYNRSLWLDLKILSETVKVIMTRRGV